MFVVFVLADLVSTSAKNTTTTTTKKKPPEFSITIPTTPPMNPRCQPLPNDVLWKRINPSGRTVDKDDDQFVPRSPRSISDGSQSGRSRSRSREWDTGSSNHTSKQPARNSRRFRKKDLYVALLGQQHPGELSPDVYRPVREGVTEGEEDGVASSRRKRKLPKNKSTQRPNQIGSPWHCRLEKKWKKMRDGVFPRQVQTGRCVAKTCMMAMYECRPRKYAIRVLRRLDGHCNPLPISGPNTTYEEVWVMDHYKVTVACECSRPKPSGTYGPTT